MARVWRELSMMVVVEEEVVVVFSSSRIEETRSGKVVTGSS